MSIKNKINHPVYLTQKSTNLVYIHKPATNFHIKSKNTLSQQSVSFFIDAKVTIQQLLDINNGFYIINIKPSFNKKDPL